LLPQHIKNTLKYHIDHFQPRATQHSPAVVSLLAKKTPHHHHPSLGQLNGGQNKSSPAPHHNYTITNLWQPNPALDGINKKKYTTPMHGRVDSIIWVENS
jgi:hypothetical protein